MTPTGRGVIYGSILILLGTRQVQSGQADPDQGQISGADPHTARAIQLGIEYEPSPPFECGHPDRAPVALLEGVIAARYAALRASFQADLQDLTAQPALSWQTVRLPQYNPTTPAALFRLWIGANRS